MISTTTRGTTVKPSIGRIVHYVSYGTPLGPDGLQAFESRCRAAIITEVGQFEPGSHEEGRALEVGLCVLTPTGQFFNQGVLYHDGSGNPGKPDCPGPHENGPHRYCACGWTEPALQGGTWHWPERVEG